MSRTDSGGDPPPDSFASEPTADDATTSDGAAGSARSLDRRVRLLWLAQAALVAGVLGSVVGVVERLVFATAPWLGPAIFLVLLAVGSAGAHLRYRSWSYQLRPDALHLERGVLTRVETVVPYVRVQHVDSRRGPGERLFGLSSIVVYTAGSQGADVTVPGLTPDRATQLRERLKRLTIAAAGEDAV